MSVRPRRPSKLAHAGTEREAAESLGVSDRTFRRWRQEAWFPGNAKTARGWNVAAIQRARDNEGKKGSSMDAERQQLRLRREQEQVRILEADRRQAEVRAAQAVGQVLPRETVEIHLTALFQSVVSFCKQLPNLVVGCVPREYQADLHSRLTAELNEWRIRLRGELIAAAHHCGQSVKLPSSDSKPAKTPAGSSPRRPQQRKPARSTAPSSDAADAKPEASGEVTERPQDEGRAPDSN